MQRALLLQAVGRHVLLAGDPVAAGEVIAAPSAGRLDAIAVCLLDVNADVQAARLAQPGDDPRLIEGRRLVPPHRLRGRRVLADPSD